MSAKLHARMTKAVVVMNARKEGTALEKTVKLTLTVNRIHMSMNGVVTDLVQRRSVIR